MAGSHRDRVELLQMQISLSQQVGVCLRSYRTAVNRQQQSAAEALNKRIDEILCMCGLDPALHMHRISSILSFNLHKLL